MTKDRVPSLDGFRAFAIILVVLAHVMMSPPFVAWHRYLELGSLGVRIFFVISGFIITELLIKEYKKNGKINFCNFYIRRALRILPVYYAYIFVVYAIDVSLGLNITPLAYLSSCLFIQNFELFNSPWLLAHTWSLSVEEQFYLIWPNIINRIRLQRVVFFWILILIIGGLARILHYKYPTESLFVGAPFFMHADFIFSGCFLATLLNEKPSLLLGFLKKQNGYYVFLMLVAIWFLSFMEFHEEYDILFIPTAGTVINLCICNLILYYIVHKETFGFRILNNRVVVKIGQLSYSIYIWQQLFTSSLDSWVTQFPQNIILISLTAYISYTLIEMPINRFKNRYATTG